MTRRPRKVIILGSAALKIGEAGEFDYSGSQAIKALREEGVATILINPNIATNQTSEHLADKVYFLPVNPYFVEQVIARERPDGMLLSFGGQTALNCGLELWRQGIFEKYDVSVLGTPVSAIEATEDREIFKQRLGEIDVMVPRSAAATSRADAVRIANEIGYPVMVRAGFALGGLGSGRCANETEVVERVDKALAHSNQVLIEEYLEGWKEIEYEVVRDSADNCITVCNMENFDPLGIHTGESIVVAPSQTLTNAEYHKLRELSIRVIRHLGVVGECNIQYALDPYSEQYRVIEVNARLSRSSALASKATGYPLAFIAAKLALGRSLLDLRNSITQSTTACFEPALDYVVVKIPRWDLKKFRKAGKAIGSSMKSVGEVMAIGRRFEEALQKALRMLETGVHGLLGNDHLQLGDLEQELRNPTDQRIFAIPAAMAAGWSVEQIHELTHIDKWFLHKIKGTLQTAERLQRYAGGHCPRSMLLEAKQLGFSDQQVGKMLHTDEQAVREMRRTYGLAPVVKQIDTLAAEYPAPTNFLYLTYNGVAEDVAPCGRKSVIVVGSGVYRIGSSVEFDWCCVTAARTLRERGYHPIMINYNPETVSTDYDECERLYFEELTFETIREIYEKEQALGVIVSMGGQTPNNLALKLHRAGIRLLGTPADMIDAAEDRQKFSALLDRLGINQPVWNELTSVDEAKAFANRVGYPVLVRPSYVLSGQAMSVASNDQELCSFLNKAADVSREHPVVLSKFIENAKEIEFDGVAREGELIVHAISEHVENAGVHSGDATLVLPPQRTYLETLRQVRSIGRKIAAALKITGPFNIQFIARDNFVKVIECNLRASRSFPFVSKVCGINFIDLATRAILGEQVPAVESSYIDLEHVGVKAPQFSFTRLQGADPVTGVEMSSTGEVGCLGSDFEEAFLKAMISVGYRLPVRSILLSTGPLKNKIEFVKNAQWLQEAGITLYATRGTAEFLHEHGIQVELLHWPLENRKPNVLDYLAERRFDLVINIPKNYEREELTNDYTIRRKAVDYNIPLITDLQLARRFTEALAHKKLEELQIKSWDEYVTPRTPATAAKAEEVNGPPTPANGRTPQRAEENGKTVPRMARA
jgi:carbamoyl-phosphate synthase large subunit